MRQLCYPRSRERCRRWSHCDLRYGKPAETMTCLPFCIDRICRRCCWSMPSMDWLTLPAVRSPAGSPMSPWRADTAAGRMYRKPASCRRSRQLRSPWSPAHRMLAGSSIASWRVRICPQARLWSTGPECRHVPPPAPPRNVQEDREPIATSSTIAARHGASFTIVSRQRMTHGTVRFPQCGLACPAASARAARRTRAAFRSKEP